MAGGWTDDQGVHNQIQDSLNDEIERATKRLPRGKSLGFCEECGEKISAARQKALPGVRLCVSCQEEADRQDAGFALYNRRGSKDSQLR